MKKRGWMVLLALAALSGLAASGWWWKDARAAGGTSAGLLPASGRIEVRRVDVAPAVGGRLMELRAHEGDSVVSGQVVARLDERTPAAEMDRARAALLALEAEIDMAGRRVAASRAQLDLARKEAGRYRNLYRDGAVSRQTLDRAEATLDRLEAETDAAAAARSLAVRRARGARDEVSMARIAREETRVASPVTGRVEHELVRVGEMTAPGQPLLTVLVGDSTKVRVYLPIAEAGRLRPGDDARVFVDAYPGRAFPGVVERIASEAEFTPRDVHMPDDRAALV